MEHLSNDEFLVLVDQLEEETGDNRQKCMKALMKCDYDYLLAKGYIKYAGCAINVPDKEKWLMDSARDYKESFSTMDND